MDLRKTNLTIEFFSKYLNILNNFQKGTPWERAFSLHSATTDTAHVPWFYHCFATIDNFCLGFLQWLKQNQNPKKQKTKKPKNHQNIKPKKQKIQNGKTNSLPLLPPLGCAISLFLFCFFGFLFFFGFLGFLVLVFWFVVGFLKG